MALENLNRIEKILNLIGKILNGIGKSQPH